MRSSARSASTPFRSGCGERAADLGNGRRARDPRAAEDAHEDVLPLRGRLRSGGEHPDVPRLPRLPRRAAGDEPDGDRVDRQARPRARLRDRAARRVRAQELLLPRSPEGLSDLAIRYAFLRKWQDDSSDAGGRPRGRHRARPPRGGRGEDRPHGRRRRAGSAAPSTRSSTTTAVARPCSRSSPRPTSARPRRRSASSSSCGRRSSSSGSPTPRWRRARCASMPTSRCGPPARTSCARAARSRT